MVKRRREGSAKISDLPPDVLKLIVSYSPRDFLCISKQFCRITRSLRTELNIASAKKFSVDHKSIFKTIFSSYNVSSLNVSGWVKWNDTSVQYLSRMMQSGYFKSLKSLYIRNCQNVSSKSLHILLQTMGRNLRAIDLFNCRNVNYKIFGPFNPNLESLYLGYSRQSDAPLENTTHVLDYFFNTVVNEKTRIMFPKLKDLQLFNYSGIKSISPLLNLSATLRHLDIRGCSGIEPSEFNTIASLKNLEELHIGLQLPNDALISITKSCKKISVLDISESPISLDVVQSICANLPRMRMLKLTKCNTLNNEGLVMLLSSLSQLSLIDVSHCWRLTNSFLDSLTKIASGNTLSKIGVYMCSLDTSKLVYKFNCAGANNVIPVIHNDLQIDINLGMTTSRTRKTIPESTGSNQPTILDIGVSSLSFL